MPRPRFEFEYPDDALLVCPQCGAREGASMVVWPTVPCVIQTVKEQMEVLTDMIEIDDTTKVACQQCEHEAPLGDFKSVEGIGGRRVPHPPEGPDRATWLRAKGIDVDDVVDNG